MSEFAVFARLARATCPKLNVSVLMYEQQSAKGLHNIRYRLKANGPGLAQEITAEADNPVGAITELRAKVREARRAFDTEAAIARISRAAGGLDEDAQAHVRRQLLACPLLAFDGTVARLRQAACDSAAEQLQAA